MKFFNIVLLLLNFLVLLAHRDRTEIELYLASVHLKFAFSHKQTFPCGILGQVRYLIVSFPDLCRLSYFILVVLWVGLWSDIVVCSDNFHLFLLIYI